MPVINPKEARKAATEAGKKFRPKYGIDTKRRFFKLIEAGLPVSGACDRIGISPATGRTWLKGLETSHGQNTIVSHAEKFQGHLPNPKTWDQLPKQAKEGLEDFNAFSVLYLARHPSPWRERVAKISVEFLLDKTEKHYVVCNLPPGVGKSTLWTLDLPLWLLCGGGFKDPTYGRALRFMLGHAAKTISEHYCLRLRRMLELTRPYFDKESRIRAERTLVEDFGRFRPDIQEGEERIWARDQFLVAQLGDVDLYEKEPSVQAASMNSEFIGERVDYAAWDDLATEKTSRDIDIANKQAEWFEKEAETRVEPGGVLWLVGQRLGPLDLFRNRLNETWADDEGQSYQKYFHIKFPVHNEATCTGDHKQWDTDVNGCILDESRIPWREIMKLRSGRHYQTVYQQEDSDPDAVLVPRIWIDGGIDLWGEEVPGCWDDDRAFMEHPKNISLVNYATVDVAAGGWWAIEWWAVEPKTRMSYLIYGLRKRLAAGGPDGFLDWDPTTQKHVGAMETIQMASAVANQGIRVWVIEANSQQRHLQQYNHFKRWLEKWRWVTVLPHQTQRNKWDEELGIEATLPMRYRRGMKRLPRSNKNPDSLNYIGHKIHELTNFPHVATTDTVMSDWMGETNLDAIIRLGTRLAREERSDIVLPPYLKRQQRTITPDKPWKEKREHG